MGNAWGLSEASAASCAMCLLHCQSPRPLGGLKVADVAKGTLHMKQHLLSTVHMNLQQSNQPSCMLPCDKSVPHNGVKILSNASAACSWHRWSIWPPSFFQQTSHCNPNPASSLCMPSFQTCPQALTHRCDNSVHKQHIIAQSS